MSGTRRGLAARLAQARLLVCDGAMGTALQEAGLAPGDCPERWNLERAGDVAAVHRGHMESGAEILQTNSFGGNPSRLSLHGLAERCEEINTAAAGIARGVAGDTALVAGSIGPTGLLLAPLGPLDSRQALEGFRRQAAALARGGCDALFVETMSDLREALLAVEGALSTGLPVAACMTFEETPRGIFTLFGTSPSDAARGLERAGASVVGTNCGTGAAAMVGVVRALRDATSLPILVQPNAGLPDLIGGRLHYPESPGSMAAQVGPLVEAGASIVGGCCGTTLAHVRAISGRIRELRISRPAPPAPA